jgi:hypothetical protein
VAVADVNGDGHPDLVVANKYGASLSLLLGNGDGSFRAAQNFTAGANPFSVAVADLNGDGRPDLVVANEGSNTVSVLLGNGNGTFKASKNFKTDALPRSVAVVDVNGDGRLDLVTCNYSGFSLSVLLGNGNGTFKAAQNYFGGPRPEAVVVADLNGDALPDLAERSLFGDGVGVLLNKPNLATHLQITAPASISAGTPFTITVTALTAGGQVDDLYPGTIHFTSSDDAALLPADYTFTKLDLGVHTFTVTLKSAGTQTITATDKSRKTVTGTASVMVSSKAADAPTPADSSRSSAADTVGQENGATVQDLTALLADRGFSGNEASEAALPVTVTAAHSQTPAVDTRTTSWIGGEATPDVPAVGLALGERSAPYGGLGVLDPVLVGALFAGTAS